MPTSKYDPIKQAVVIALKRKYLPANGDPSTTGKPTRGK